MLTHAALDAILFAADNANFDLENCTDAAGEFQHLLSDTQVFGHWHRRAIPHVRVEQRVFAALNAVLRNCN